MDEILDSVVVLISGASQGVGKVCAQHLGRAGYRVYAGSRSYSDPGSTAEDHDHAPQISNIYLDVTEQEAVSKCVEHILNREGRLDVLVNNAGFGIAGSVEDTSIEECKSQFETNFFGAVRMCRDVLPIMRAQGSGMILNISSLAGKVAVPFQSAYSASKFALEGFTDSLRIEVYSYGIRVVLLEPGDLKTEFTSNRQRTAASSNSVYQERFESALGIMEDDERNGTPAKDVAVVVERILRSSNPKPRYQVGPWFERAALVAKKFIPEKAFDAGLSRYYHLR